MSKEKINFTNIAVSGMEDENSVRFGCHSCGYVWYEEVEDEDDDDDY
jgi:transposase-like protein